MRSTYLLLVCSGYNEVRVGTKCGAMRQRDAYGDEKKMLVLSHKGEPIGSMKEVFKKEWNAYVKQLNPYYNWVNQVDNDRDNFRERMDSEYEYIGGREKLCEKFFKGVILTTISRYSLESFLWCMFLLTFILVYPWLCRPSHWRACILMFSGLSDEDINMTW